MFKKSYALYWLAALLLACSTSVAAAPRILVLGDSLCSAHDIPKQDGWVTLLGERLGEEGYAYEVVDACRSGRTTGGGLALLPKLLTEHEPEVVVLELGGNDGLRKQSVEQMRDNLASMIEQAQQADSLVLLLGIILPPKYPEKYRKEFAAVYSQLAEEYEVSLVPFFLSGVILNPAMMQADRVHPNAEAQPVLLDTVWGKLERLLERNPSE